MDKAQHPIFFQKKEDRKKKRDKLVIECDNYSHHKNQSINSKSTKIFIHFSASAIYYFHSLSISLFCFDPSLGAEIIFIVTAKF